MQKEIKNYRISEQDKLQSSNELNKIHFKDFTNYKPLRKSSTQDIKNEPIKPVDPLTSSSLPIYQTDLAF